MTSTGPTYRLCAIKTLVQAPETIFRVINVRSTYSVLHILTEQAGAMRKRNTPSSCHPSRINFEDITSLSGGYEALSSEI